RRGIDRPVARRAHLARAPRAHVFESATPHFDRHVLSPAHSTRGPCRRDEPRNELIVQSGGAEIPIFFGDPLLQATVWLDAKDHAHSLRRATRPGNDWYPDPNMFIALAVALGVALVGADLYRRYAPARALDVPNARSSHTRPTPRGGGLVIVA